MKKSVLLLMCMLLMTCGTVFAAEEIADTAIEEQQKIDQAKEKVVSEIGTMVNSQKYKTALIKCDNALQKYPDEAFLYYWKGTILSTLNDKVAALENYNKAVELNPENAKTFVMRGICKYDLGDMEGAIEDYNKAIELDANDSTAYSMRACAKLELGDFTGANEDLDMANKLMNSKSEE